MRNIIFEIKGGIGKSVLATAVCEGIKKKYPESHLIVLTAYPDVFVNNANVYRTFAFNQLSYFYEEYLKDNDFIYFGQEPYLQTSFLKQKEHLIETWFDLCGLTYEGEQPHLYITDRERKFAEAHLPKDKPLFILQTNGGAESQGLKYSWARDIPYEVGKKVIAAFKDSHHILHIRREDQFSFDNTVTLNNNFRFVAAVILMSDKRLFMDSFAQHTAAALGLSSTVLWIANKPEVFGYSLHTNIKANPETAVPDLRESYLTPYDIAGNLIQFPYNNEDEIFDVKRVIDSLSLKEHTHNE